jgi:hypothetical protein
MISITNIGGTTNEYQLFQMLVERLVPAGSTAVVAAIVITSRWLRLFC